TDAHQGAGGGPLGLQVIHQGLHVVQGVEEARVLHRAGSGVDEDAHVSPSSPNLWRIQGLVVSISWASRSVSTGAVQWGWSPCSPAATRRAATASPRVQPSPLPPVASTMRANRASSLTASASTQ